MAVTFIGHSSVDPVFGRPVWVPAHTRVRFSTLETQNSTAAAFRTYMADAVANVLGQPVSDGTVGNQKLKPLAKEEIRVMRSAMPPALAASEVYLLGEHPYPDPICLCDADPGPCTPGRDHHCGGILSTFRGDLNLIVCRGVLHTAIRDALPGEKRERMMVRTEEEARERNRNERREKTYHSAAERAAGLPVADTAAGQAQKKAGEWNKLQKQGRFDAPVLTMWNGLTDDEKMRLRSFPEIYRWDEQRQARDFVDGHPLAPNFAIYAFVARHVERWDIVEVLKEDGFVLAKALGDAGNAYHRLTENADERAVAVWNTFSPEDQQMVQLYEPGIVDWLTEAAAVRPQAQAFDPHDVDRVTAEVLKTVLRAGAHVPLRLVTFRHEGTEYYAFREGASQDGTTRHEGGVRVLDVEGRDKLVIDFDPGTPPPDECLAGLRHYLDHVGALEYELA